MTGLVEDLTDKFIDANRMLDNGWRTSPASTFTSSGTQGLLNYTFDLGVYTGNVLTGTMNGQLSVYFDQSLPNGKRTGFQVSYTIDAELVAGSIRFTGRNGELIPFRAVIEEDDDYIYFGTGSIDFFLSCTTTFDVPESDPLEPDDEDGREDLHEEGQNAVTVENMIDEDTTDTLVSDLFYDEDGILAINSKINGIAVPATTFEEDD